MAKILKIQILIIFLLLVNNNFANVNEENDEKTKIVYSNSIFLKYGNTNYSINSNQLKSFLKQFFYSIINEFDNSSTNSSKYKTSCIKSKAKSFLDIASNLNDDILVNTTIFNKLSSLLITNLDSCLNPSTYNQSFNLNSSYKLEKSIFNYFNLNSLKNKFISISTEGIILQF